MKKQSINACILRTAGTNSDLQTEKALLDLRIQVSRMHIKELIKKNNLLDYNLLVLPGGFSYSDYVRAGAIWAKEIISHFKKDINLFLDDGRPIIGICNGFQVLVETGLLPDIPNLSFSPQATVTTNASSRFECRWVSNDDFLYIKNVNKGKCVFTKKINSGSLLKMPIAHGEGRISFLKDKEQKYITKLEENDQLVFRFVDKNGDFPNQQYPVNPNGSIYDITGICNDDGTVFGLMPHPERAYYGWQLPDWTRMENVPIYGDGKLLFDSVVDYISKKF